MSSDDGLPAPMGNLVQDIANFQFTWVRTINAVQEIAWESSSDHQSPLLVNVRPVTLPSSV